MASSVVVVVVGGGASGLTAALELKKSASAYYTSPITVLVMEASSRLGGRILPCDVPVEYESIGGGVLYERVQLGAEYVHGGEHLLDAFLSQKNIKRIPACVAAQGDGGPSGFQESQATVAYYCGKRKTFIRFQPDNTSSTEPWLANLNAHLRSLADDSNATSSAATTGKSVADGLPRDSFSREMADAGYGNTLAAGSCTLLDEGETRIMEVAWDKQASGDATPEGGMSRVIEELAADVCDAIRLNHYVHTIARDAETNRIRVGYVASYAHPDDANSAVPEEHANEILVDAVIYTGSLPSLAHVDVSPPLPKVVIEAARGSSHSPVAFASEAIKAAVIVRGCPYGEDSDTDLHAVICSNSLWPEISFRRAKVGDNLWVCGGFVSGTCAEDLKSACISRAGAARWRNETCVVLLEQLDSMFGDGGKGWRASAGQLIGDHDAEVVPPSNRVVGAAAYAWGSDPHARGGYTFPRLPGASHARASLNAALWPDARAPPFFLAGEACGDDDGAPMTVHAAMESGRRAARRAIASIAGRGTLQSRM
ncbi:amine oxidase domain-containing protein [Pseudoscourfieldia marina]